MIINILFSTQFTFRNPFLCDLLHLGLLVRLGEQHSDSSSTGHMHEAASSQIQASFPKTQAETKTCPSPPEDATWAQSGLTSTVGALARLRSVLSSPGNGALAQHCHCLQEAVWGNLPGLSLPEALNHTPEQQFSCFKRIDAFNHHNNPTP